MSERQYLLSSVSVHALALAISALVSAHKHGAERRSQDQRDVREHLERYRQARAARASVRTEPPPESPSSAAPPSKPVVNAPPGSASAAAPAPGPSTTDRKQEVSRSAFGADESAPESGSNSAVGSGANVTEGFEASIVSEHWAKLDRELRGPAWLARQQKRRSLDGYSAELDQELKDAETWLEPRRTFLGTNSGTEWFFLDAWYVIGPFDNTDRKNHETAFPPETLVDLDAAYTGKHERVVRWKFVQSSRPPVVPPLEEAYAIYYAYTELRSDRARSIWLAIGADDSMKVWVNDQLVWQSSVHLKPWVLAEGFARAKLVEGFNRVLIRLENAPQGAAFSVTARIGP